MSEEPGGGNQPDTVDEEYKKYCKSESDEAYTTITKNQDEYDKQLLTLSTGLLAVLIAFLKDLVHLDTAICKPLLYCGIAGFGLSILFVIVSFQISIFALQRVREYFEQHFSGNIEFNFQFVPACGLHESTGQQAFHLFVA